MVKRAAWSKILDLASFPFELWKSSQNTTPKLAWTKDVCLFEIVFLTMAGEQIGLSVHYDMGGGGIYRVAA